MQRGRSLKNEDRREKKKKRWIDIAEGFEQLWKYSREFSQPPKAQDKPWQPCVQFKCSVLCLQAAALHTSPSTSLRTNHKPPLVLRGADFPTQTILSDWKQSQINYFSGKQSKSEGCHAEKSACGRSQGGQRLQTSALTSWTSYHLLSCPSLFKWFPIELLSSASPLQSEYV